MKKIIVLMTILAGISLYSVYIPTAEPVYGGRIEHIRTISLDSTTTRVFITTNSANSMFYADMSDVTTTPSYGSFTVVPDLDEHANYGWIRSFAADDGSQFVYAVTSGFGVVACDISSGSLFTVDSNIGEAVEVYDSYLFYITYSGSDVVLNYGQIYDTSYGSYCGQIYNPGSVIITSGGYTGEFAPDIMINPADNYLYVFEDGTPPVFYKSSATYDMIDAATTFSNLTVSDLNAVGKQYIAAGIAPDGRIFCGSYEGYSGASESHIAYSDSDGDPWNDSVLSQDVGRGEIFVTQNSDADYNVVFSRVASLDNGINWDSHGGADGSVYFDPNNDSLLYVRTDWAMGAVELPLSFSEINDGIQAVQVNDFAMDEDKDIAWVASKSGIWYVYDYSTPTPTWTTTPLWPDYDSTPYITATTTRTADSVYVGNTSGNAFKYESAYGTLSDANFAGIFEAQNEDPTWTYGTKVTAISIDPVSSSERLFLGTYDDEDWDETTETQGGIFVGEYSGSWNWSQLSGSPMPSDGVEVYDIVAIEESGVSVAYAGCEYVYGAYGTGYGVYRIEDDGYGGWNITQDLYDSTGTVIAVTIFDLYADSLNNLYACGIDAGWTTVVPYYKEYGGSYWEVLETSGLPTSIEFSCLTLDEATGDLYMAIENEVYVLQSGAPSWALLTSVAEGNEIEFIYYDDLLLGSGTGLYLVEFDEYPLYPPGDITIEMDETNVYLSWNEVYDATSYTIYSDTDFYGSFFTVEDSLITDTEWYEPIPPEDMKFYKVTANR